MGIELQFSAAVQRTILYVMGGYLSGNVLYARVFAKLFGKGDFLELSRDHNPGAANAFRYGGFWCGLLTLVCDLLKGFLPVFLYASCMRSEDIIGLSFALVMAAPVVGHAFPVCFHFQGGKAIAVSFGCLLGLLPAWKPAALLAVFFIFFSLVLRITPHYHRTLITYLCAMVSMFFVTDQAAIEAGFLLISAVVILRMLRSKEEREQMEVQLLWMR